MATIRNEHHHQRHESGWTEPRVARLKELWKEGFSAGQIADDLKGGVTRNGVIGKLHRLGLSERHGAGGSKPVGAGLASAINSRASRKPRANPKPVRVAADASRTYAQPAPVALPPEPVVQAEPLMLTLLELPGHGCKWPIGAPAPVQRFCGHRRHGETPYCQEHARIGYSSASSLAKHSASELVRSLRRFV